MFRPLVATVLLLWLCPAPAVEPVKTDTPTSFVGKLFFGKQEDFGDMKRQRRQLIAEITRLENDVRANEVQIEQLNKLLQDAPASLARLSDLIRRTDALIAEKASSDSPRKAKAESAGSGASRLLNEIDFLGAKSIEELKARKSDLEQRHKDILEKQQRHSQLQDDQKKKRYELETKQAELVNLEDRIGLALNTGTNQYIYRTIVSLMFAAIVAFLVRQFFRIVQTNDDVKQSIFSGDTGIQFITLFSIVIAVILFGILEILGANELSALLGGLSGYILGKSAPALKQASGGPALALPAEAK